MPAAAVSTCSSQSVPVSWVRMVLNISAPLGFPLPHSQVSTPGSPHDRRYGNDPERALDTIMFLNRNVAADCQGMQVQLEERFIIRIVTGIIVETPSLADVPQNTALGLSGAPKPDNAAMVFDLFPGAGIDMIVLRQGSDELIAIFRTSSGKFRRARQFESD